MISHGPSPFIRSSTRAAAALQLAQGQQDRRNLCRRASQSAEQSAQFFSFFGFSSGNMPRESFRVHAASWTVTAEGVTAYKMAVYPDVSTRRLCPLPSDGCRHPAVFCCYAS